jgi:Tol biopolymer transport system component
VLVSPVDRRLALGLVSVVVLVALCAAAGPASASFPGRNGEIVFGWTADTTYRGGPSATSIRAVDPRSGRVRVLRDCPLRRDVPVAYADCTVGDPRYSPDGQRIAFLSNQVVLDATGHPSNTRPGLATMASDGTGLQVHATEHWYGTHAWAPAGDRLLLVRSLGSFEPNAIFLASPDGTELGQVSPAPGEDPDWSSRGEIAFTQSADPCPPGCDDIHIMRVGGTPRRLTYRGGNSPSWSPHGTKLAFVRAVRSRSEIFLVRRNGGGLRRLTYGGGYNPAWSPDGKWIAFIRNGDLYVMRTNGRGRRRLVDSPFEALQFWGSIDWQPRPG